MVVLSLEGTYKDGKIELDERPTSVGESARVIVIFLPTSHPGGGPAGADSGETAARRAAGRRLIAMMNEGIDLGGPPYPKREEIYDRVNRLSDRLDKRGG